MCFTCVLFKTNFFYHLYQAGKTVPLNKEKWSPIVNPISRVGTVMGCLVCSHMRNVTPFTMCQPGPENNPFIVIHPIYWPSIMGKLAYLVDTNLAKRWTQRVLRAPRSPLYFYTVPYCTVHIALQSYCTVHYCTVYSHYLRRQNSASGEEYDPLAGFEPRTYSMGQ